VASADQLTIMGRSIDRLVTVEMRLGEYSRGVAAKLHAAALAAQDAPSLSLLAAQRLQARVAPGDAVLVVTGAGHAEHMPAGETDGPLGAAGLARALQRGLDARPVLLTAAPYAPPVEASLHALGLGDLAVLPLASDAQAIGYVERHAPAAVVSIETLTANRAGVAHTASGMAATDEQPHAAALIDAARERGVLTVGIGDNGNEAGYGLIEAAVREHKPFGDVCRCPCGGGIASATVTDVLVTGNVSNWAAYGVEAMLAALLGEPDVLHGAAEEAAMLDGALAAGAIDGSTGRPVPLVDGTGLEVQQAVLTMLRAIVENGLAEPPGRRF
jgi:hypothetical protein